MKKIQGSPNRKFIDNKFYHQDGVLVIDFGYYLASRANLSHTHWRTQHAQAKEQRQIGAGLLFSAYQELHEELQWPPKPTSEHHWLVKMTRLSPKPLDCDNLASAFKSLRDGVADSLGTDDKWRGNIKWQYHQELSKEFGIKIELTRLKPT